MESARFDDLTRSLAGRASRRGVLGGLVGLAAGLAVPRRSVAACPPGRVSRNGSCLCKQTGRPPIDGICPCPKGQSDTGDGLGCLECRGVAECPPSDACVQYACTAGKCAKTRTVCDDGEGLCTTKTCDLAQGCVFVPVICDDGKACTTDSCDPGAGCAATPLSDGEPCQGLGGTCCAGGCTSLEHDVHHCGACGHDCLAAANVAQAECVGGGCRMTDCALRYGDCDEEPANGCETLLGSTSNCTACGESCGGATPYCDPARGCVACLMSAQCGVADACTAYTCATGACGSTALLADGATCGVNQICSGGRCVACGEEGLPCCAGDACIDGSTVCDSGACVAPKLALGAPCTHDAACASDFCTDGVCCQVRCVGDDLRCNEAGLCTISIPEICFGCWLPEDTHDSCGNPCAESCPDCRIRSEEGTCVAAEDSSSCGGLFGIGLCCGGQCCPDCQICVDGQCVSVANGDACRNPFNTGTCCQGGCCTGDNVCTATGCVDACGGCPACHECVRGQCQPEPFTSGVQCGETCCAEGYGCCGPDTLKWCVPLENLCGDGCSFPPLWNCLGTCYAEPTYECLGACYPGRRQVCHGRCIPAEHVCCPSVDPFSGRDSCPADNVCCGLTNACCPPEGICSVFGGVLSCLKP